MQYGMENWDNELGVITKDDDIPILRCSSTFSVSRFRNVCFEGEKKNKLRVVFSNPTQYAAGRISQKYLLVLFVQKNFSQFLGKQEISHGLVSIMEMIVNNAFQKK